MTDRNTPPHKELGELKKAAEDYQKMAKWKGFRPLTGAGWPRTVLLQYHANLQLGATVMRRFARTPLFIVGTTFVTATFGFYKYLQTTNDQNQIKQLEENLKQANRDLAVQRQKTAALQKEVDDMNGSWLNLRGWFKKK